jgi:TRAP-type C4-dicarboxylate transport system substrate-binding protein
MHRTIALSIAVATLTATTAAADEVTLRFAPLSQPQQAITKEFWEPWVAKVNADGKGVLALDMRPGTTIANIFNIYPRVMNDVMHIGFELHNYVSGKFNYSEVAALPFMAETGEQASVALWRLYKTGALDKEYDEAIPLMLIGLPQSLLHANKAPKQLDDWGGMKIIGPTQLTALVTKYMGGTPLTLGSSEIYEAVQRGTAEGGIVSYNAYQSFKLHEVTSYHIDTTLGTASGMIFMSRKVYAGMPDAAKKVLDAHTGESGTRAWSKWWDDDNERGRKMVKADPKHTVVVLTPKQREEWKRKVDGAIAEWAKSRPGVEPVIARYRQLLAQVAAEKK